jgi:electron transport complex protein RnfB
MRRDSMSEVLYQRLRERLDQYGVGFPATGSGVEVRILRKLFTEEEAELFLHLGLALEIPDSVAERAGRDPKAVGDLLRGMAEKGLVFRLRKGGSTRYAAVPFVIGSFEFQVKTMDRELAELAELTEEYFNEGFLTSGIAGSVLPLRTVPVNRSLDVAWPVAPYEDAREIIKGKDKIALSDCICRVQQGLLDKGCDKPKEVCFSFGSHADFYVERGMGRYVTQEEALAVLDLSEKVGLVNQPANMVNPGGMCNCCGDCCGVLRALNRMPKPAEMVTNNYFAVVDTDLCTGCETCLDRCQMVAIHVGNDQTAEVDPDRCIGCGLCVTTCPTAAIRLHLKPEELQRQPPASGRELAAMTAERWGAGSPHTE